ncbi:MAG: hypothetical protein ACPGU1_00240 [Myxococcota bacterium]
MTLLACSTEVEPPEGAHAQLDTMGSAPDEGGPSDSASSVEDVTASPADAEVDPLDDAEVLPSPLVYATCLAAERLGGFLVTLAEDYTGASGQVLDGVVPANVPELVQTEGACQLMRAKSLHCDPNCVPGEACAESGACVPYPERSSVGEVVISGLFDPLTMEAKWGNTYTNQGSMVHPGYPVGASLELSAEGGAFGAFSLRGVGVEALEQTGAQEIVVEAGAPMSLSWVPPTVDGPVKVHVELNLNNHGSTSAWIACDVPDTGTYTVPSSLLEALYAIGVSGFPSLTLSRRSVDSTTVTQGCVDFVVHSDRNVPITISGVTSCTQDMQCPPGQSCGADLACH